MVDKYNNEEVLAVIPARGGSMGLPRKNALDFSNGESLTSISVKQAVKASQIHRVLISSDSNEIIEQAVSAGAEALYVRSSTLATCDATLVDVLMDLLEHLDTQKNYTPEYIVVLQPTSPLRRVEDIDNAVKLLMESDSNIDCVISVTASPVYPELLKTISNKGELLNYFPCEPNHARRQDLTKTFIPNGALYVLRVSSFLKERQVYMRKIKPYIMETEHSIDIDTELDFFLAKKVYEEYKND